MRVTPRFSWTARKAGGLFLGLRLSFPCSVYEPGKPGEEDAVRFTQMWLSIGFVLFTLHLDFNYHFRPVR